MSCILDIDDIVEEMLIGPVTPIAGLPEIQVAGVLTAVRKTVDQPSTTISNKGLGAYGLSIADLQLTGIVKCGVDPEQLIEDILADPSVFTGKDNVTEVADLIGSPEEACESVADRLAREQAAALQQKLMNAAIIANMDSLKLQGVTGETDQETATLAGQSSKFSPFEIIANIAGTIGDIAGAAMDAIGILAAAAALIAVVKNADILGKLKGFGKQVASLPELATDTLTSALGSVNGGLDSIIGSTRIPSVSDITASAAEAGGSILDSVTSIAGDTLDSVTSIASNTIDAVSNINPEDYIG